MNRQSPPQSEGLPPHIRLDPHYVSWRLDRHEERLFALENPREAAIRTPWGAIPWPIAVTLLGLLLAFRPDLAEKIIIGLLAP